MHPVLFDFTPILSAVGINQSFQLHTYGLMIALGFLIGMQLSLREARRIDVSEKRNFDQFVMDLTFWILLVSIAGARLLFIFVELKDYTRDPLKVIRIWEGGLVFYGGFLSSVLFSWYYSWKKGQNFFLVSDTLIPSVALGHFFGRLGCFAAGCCWGAQVDSSFPLGVQFPAGSLAYNTMRSTGLIGYDAPFTFHVHPVQLYESSGELMIFFILLLMRTRKRFHGQVLLTYLFLYPILRTSLELIRGDKGRGVDLVLGLSTSQIISVIVASTAIVTLIFLVRRRGTVEPPATPLSAAPS
jgi:phosphatidylglycerol---prolipoprotein diacylglyceryl transferase